MPKKILYESAVHQFLWAGRRLRENLSATNPAEAARLADWINALTIENPGPGGLRVVWSAPIAGEHRIELKHAKFYTRGDAPAHSHASRRPVSLFTTTASWRRMLHSSTPSSAPS